MEKLFSGFNITKKKKKKKRREKYIVSASEKQSTVSVALLELKTGVFVGAVVQMFENFFRRI